jgi:hypothetical protein
VQDGERLLPFPWTAAEAWCQQIASTIRMSCTLQPGYEVVLIGYRGAALIEELQEPTEAGRLSVAYLPDL